MPAMETRQTPYRSLNAFYRDRFGARTWKVGVKAGFTCPNRDGARGTGGCTYCSDRNLVPATYSPGMGVREQVEAGIAFLARRNGAEKFIVYFQDFSATYGDPDRLEALYREAVDHPAVAGLAVGTRPDCLGPAVLAVLERLARRVFVQLELGLQSASDRTLEEIRRGHTVAEYEEAHLRARQAGLHVVSHVIVGFPWEDRDDHLRTMDLLNRLRADGVKLHALHLIEGTELARRYRENPFALMTRGEYVGRVVELVERAHPDMVMHRLTGETAAGLLLEPRWVLDKGGVVEEIRARMLGAGARQGRLFRAQGAA